MLVPSLLYISSNETLLFLNIANEEQIRGKEKQARLTVLSCVVRRSLQKKMSKQSLFARKLGSFSVFSGGYLLVTHNFVRHWFEPWQSAAIMSNSWF